MCAKLKPAGHGRARLRAWRRRYFRWLFAWCTYSAIAAGSTSHLAAYICVCMCNEPSSGIGREQRRITGAATRAKGKKRGEGGAGGIADRTHR